MTRALERFVRRVKALTRRRGLERDVDEELDAFADAARDHHLRKGRTHEEAVAAAQRAVGSRTLVKERVRDGHWTSALEGLWRDVTYACRCLARQPGFTAAAVLTLGLGIGISTAVFTVVDAVLVQPLPYAHADRLVRIVERAAPAAPGAALLRRTSMRWAEMTEWRARTSTLADMAFTVAPPITLMPSADGAVRLSGALVSTNLFTLLGAEAALGRPLDARDELAGADTVVISTAAWRRYFGGRPDIVGMTIPLETLGPEAGLFDGRPLTIVGVMPQTFDYPVPYADFWAAIAADSPVHRWPGAGAVIARLAPGASVQAAVDEANAIGAGLRPKPSSGPLARPLPDGVRRFDVEAVKEQVVASSRPALRALAIAVGVLLLIVCANVGGLLLARGLARQREIAVRVALGAGRGRVMRQLLTESSMLALAGGIPGALLATAGVWLLRALASPDASGPFLISFGGDMLPRLHEVSVDLRTLGIAASISVVAATLIGIVPALALRWTAGGRGTLLVGADSAQRGTMRPTSHARDALVACQVAMATLLLIGAGLIVGSFGRLVRVDPGWNASGVLTFYLAVPQEYDTTRHARIVGDLLEELRAVPGVEGAGFTYAGPLLGLVDKYGVFVPPGRTVDEMRGNPDNPQLRSVSSGLLPTLDARLVAGRWLGPEDDETAPPVLMVNRAVVERLFGGRDPVGQLVHFDGRMDLPPQRIIGVVDDMRQGSLDKDPAPQMFFDYRQLLALTRERGAPAPQQERLVFGFHTFVVRTGLDPASLMPAVRDRVHHVDPNLGIDVMMPMEQLVTSSLTRQRFYATVMGIFAATAAALSVIGIYGVLAYGVTRRTPEIGLRMALGAEGGAIRRLILRRGMRLCLPGILVGLAGAMMLSRFLDSMLYGVEPLDPATYASAAALYALTTALACWLPARRATRVDPVVALRYE